MKINVRFVENIMLLLFFLFAMGLFNMSGHILAFLILLFFLTSITKKIVVDKLVIVLLLFSLCYFIDYAMFWEVGVKEVITYLLAPWCCFLISENMVIHSKSKAITEKIILAIVVGLFIHGLLNFYIYLKMYGLHSYGMGTARVSYDFWRKEMIAVTACALYFVPMISLSLGYLFYGKKKLYKGMSVIAIVTGILINVAYSNRTVFGILLLLIVIRLVSNISIKAINIRKVVVLLLVITGVIWCWSTNLGGIQSYIMELNITQRFLSGDTGRMEVWAEYLQSEWWRYPFGGQHFRSVYKYAHNMWMDTFNTAGALPFVLLTTFTAGIIGIMRKNRVYFYLMAGMLISCALEPIMEANPYYLFSLIIIAGALKGKV